MNDSAKSATNNTNNTLRLYNHEISGKVRLLLSLLGLNYELVRVDLMKGEHKQPDFLALNPFGQVPVLVDGNTMVSDSQAILTYPGPEIQPSMVPHRAGDGSASCPMALCCRQ